MSLHLRGIHSAVHERADVRVARRQAEKIAEQLRSEMDAVRPLLRWPLPVNLNRKQRSGK